MYDNASDLHNSLLVNCEQQYSDLSDEKSKLSKHNSSILFLGDYEYNNYFDKEPRAVKEESDNFPPLEGNEEKYYSVPFSPLQKGDEKNGRD